MLGCRRSWSAAWSNLLSHNPLPTGDTNMSIPRSNFAASLWPRVLCVSIFFHETQTYCTTPAI